MLQPRAAHNVIMENRRVMSLSGVRDVDSFDEQTVVVLTEMGELTIRGVKLHISRLDQDTGEMLLDGEISELIYSDAVDEPKGFFARLFR
ncbi:MAG: sporulation protein YabP [Ruminococcaceae bacterium]|nr:sporulation protein YabP [Oscillospiraceae bacterium]